MHNLFSQWEQLAQENTIALDVFLDALPFNAEGLLPAIAQQFDSKEVLMLAWVNRASLLLSLQEKTAVYWSRSRQALWRKGESSGQTQQLKEVRLDCDGDSILFLVDQTGPACHTGRRNCFYFSVEADQVRINATALIDPSLLYC